MENLDKGLPIEHSHLDVTADLCFEGTGLSHVILKTTGNLPMLPLGEHHFRIEIGRPQRLLSL